MKTLRKLFLTASIFLVAAWVHAADAPVIRLATTTSTANSGLLDYLLPTFEQHCQCMVHVIAVGTGKALKLAEDGNVDVVLVHARIAEDAFVAAGHGVNRRDVMYNDFIVIGPAADPAKIKGDKDVVHAMQKIARSHARFISRGDDSGTDQMEKIFWKQAGIAPAENNEPRWYFSTGQGMGEVLMMSSEMRAYTLTDRATYISYRDKLELSVLLEGDPSLFNPYGIIAVNQKKHQDINYRGAMALIDWITSAAGQQRIGAYKVHDAQLFVPSARQ